MIKRLPASGPGWLLVQTINELIDHENRRIKKKAKRKLKEKLCSERRN